MDKLELDCHWSQLDLSLVVEVQVYAQQVNPSASELARATSALAVFPASKRTLSLDYLFEL